MERVGNFIFVSFSLLWLGIYSIESLAEETPAPKIKNTVWIFSLTGKRHSLKAGDGNEFIGNAADISLGSGYIGKAFYVNGAVDVILGPYEPTRQRQLDVDYLGTGFSLWWGYSAQTLDLRSAEGNYGFALGLSYADIVGHSLGKNRKEGTSGSAERDGLIDNYIMRITDFSVVPSIFFAWLKEGRPEGNTPELLTTRIEGYLLTIGIAMPILISYSARYDQRQEESQEAAFLLDNSVTVTEKGKLRGYTILASFAALLGI